ncbi:MAG: DciA family protein [Actinomycetota bacterium]
MKGRRHEPESLKNLLPGVGRKLGLDAAVETGLVWQKWPEIVGEAVAAHAEPTSLRNGVLKVRTDSPTWATEIGYLGRQIALKANEVAGCRLVTEVRVWTGPGKPKAERRTAHVDVQEGRPDQTSRTVEAPDPLSALAAARAAWKRRFGRGS